MARYVVQMTFEVPRLTGPYRGRAAIGDFPVGPVRGGRIRCIAVDGTIATLGTVKAESAADAAMYVAHRVAEAWRQHGTGPISLASWHAVRDRVLVGHRDSARGGGFPFDEDGGTAGVREPRRPKPSPGSLSAALDVPRERF